MSHTYEELEELCKQRAFWVARLEREKHFTDAEMSKVLVKQRIAEHTVDMLNRALDDELRRRGEEPPCISRGLADADEDHAARGPAERIKDLRGAVQKLERQWQATEQACLQATGAERRATERIRELEQELASAKAKRDDELAAARSSNEHLVKNVQGWIKASGVELFGDLALKLSKMGDDLAMLRLESERWRAATGCAGPEFVIPRDRAWQHATGCGTPEQAASEKLARQHLAGSSAYFGKDRFDVAREWQAATRCNTPGEARQAMDVCSRDWQNATGEHTPEEARERRREFERCKSNLQEQGQELARERFAVNEWRIATRCKTTHEAAIAAGDYERVLAEVTAWRKVTGCLTPAQAEKEVTLLKAGEHRPGGPWDNLHRVEEQWKRATGADSPAAAQRCRASTKADLERWSIAVSAAEARIVSWQQATGCREPGAAELLIGSLRRPQVTAPTIRFKDAEAAVVEAPQAHRPHLVTRVVTDGGSEWKLKISPVDVVTLRSVTVEFTE